jgi:hypothetical protein
LLASVLVPDPAINVLPPAVTLRAFGAVRRLDGASRPL